MDRGAWQARVHGVAKVGHDLYHLNHCLLGLNEYMLNK